MSTIPSTPPAIPSDIPSAPPARGTGARGADRGDLAGGAGATRAMLWKELRENARWAALALLAVGAGMAYALYHSTTFPGQLIDLSLAGHVPGLTVVGMPAAALLLGLLQVLPERRPDRWAFLVHRPMTRSRLFLCKAAAGLGLYLPAAGLPLLAACLWSAAPGRIAAPFDWRLALPGLADLFAGAAWYFAGMLVGLRPARWYGSRLPVVGAALVGSVLVVAAPEFRQALLAAAASAAVTGVAAWGAFLAGGAEPAAGAPEAVPEGAGGASGGGARRHRLARAALAVTLFCGFLIATGAAVGLVSSVFFEGRGADRPFTMYDVAPDGQVLRVTQEGLAITAVTDPAGRPVEKYKDVTDVNQLGGLLGYARGATLRLDPPGRRAGVPFRDGYRNAARYVLAAGQGGGGGARTFWYYLFDKRELVGYDARTAARVGAIGPDGFTPGAGDVARPFPGPLRPQDDWYGSWYDGRVAALTFPSAAYLPLLDRRRVEPIFAAPAGESIVSGAFTALPPSDAGRQAPPPVRIWVAATDKALYLVPRVQGPPGAPAASGPAEPAEAATRAEVAAAPPPVRVALARDADTYQQVQVVPVSGGGYVVRYMSLYPTTERAGRPEYVQHLSADGKVEGEAELPPLPWPAAPTPVGTTVLAGLTLPPAGVALVGLLNAAADSAVPLRQALLNPEMVTLGAACLLAAVACATVASALGRRYAFRPAGRWGWAAGAFLLGPAALLTLLSTWQWPARERCPSCGRKRVVTREHCEHCGAAFEPPAPDGTEIFEA